MNIDNREQAQQRSDRIQQFRDELRCLESGAGLELSGSQHEQIETYHQAVLAGLAQRFDIDHNAQTRQLSLGMRAASFLGALALATSLYFLFYRFWGQFNELSQVITLISAPLLGLLLTAVLHQRDSSGYFSKLAALLSFSAFVLNLVMLGQIFNITPSDKALLPLAALALLLAYACELRLLLAAGLLCLITYVAARVGTWSGMYWLDFGQRPENFFPLALLLIGIPQLISQRRFSGFVELYRILGLCSLLLPMLVLANWGYGSYLPLDSDLIEGAYQLLGFALSALAIWLGIRRRWTDVSNTGLVFFVIFLFTKLFDWWWEILPKYLFFLLIGLVAILVLLILRRLRRVQTDSRQGVQP